MKSAADRSNRESQNRAVGSLWSTKTGGSRSSFRFVDNRPETAPLSGLPEMGDNSLQPNQAAHLRAMIYHSPRMVVQRQQVESMTGQPVRRAGMEKELQELQELQLKAETAPVQRAGIEDDELVQGKFQPLQKQENNTGLQKT